MLVGRQLAPVEPEAMEDAGQDFRHRDLHLPYAGAGQRGNGHRGGQGYEHNGIAH
ncbi:hypothetical protein D3C74_424210 [compost metagenome]